RGPTGASIGGEPIILGLGIKCDEADTPQVGQLAWNTPIRFHGHTGSIRDTVIEVRLSPHRHAVQVAVVVCVVDAVADDVPIALTSRRYSDVRHPNQLILAFECFVDGAWHRCAAT